jgi:hypothetical protein
MTFPNSSPERPGAPPGFVPENHQDIIPTSERSQDSVQTETEHDLTLDSPRPLTEDERNAADRDVPVGERVYAPASKRVPKQPVAGHREVIEHPDTHTAEREAASQTATHGSTEPSFTRVSRPSTTPGYDTPAPGAYGSPMSNPAFGTHNESDLGHDRRKRMFFGIGFSWVTVICAGVGLWLYMRWQRERNKPINRLRRQAQQAAAELRERMPDPDDAVRPAMGVTTAMLSLLLVLWRQSQARSRDARKKVGRRTDKAAHRASEAVADIDWHKRLTKLKERWDPSRLELEKVSISRH